MEELSFWQRYICKRDRMRSKMTPRKMRTRLKRRRDFNKKVRLKMSLVGSTKNKENSHLLELRGKHQRSRRVGGPCLTSAAVTEGEEHQMAMSSAKRELLTSVGRDAGRSLMKRENRAGQKLNFHETTSTHSSGSIYLILKNHASAPFRKQRLRPLATKKTNRNSGRKLDARKSQKLWRSR